MKCSCIRVVVEGVISVSVTLCLASAHAFLFSLLQNYDRLDFSACFTYCRNPETLIYIWPRNTDKTLREDLQQFIRAMANLGHLTKLRMSARSLVTQSITEVKTLHGTFSSWITARQTSFPRWEAFTLKRQDQAIQSLVEGDVVESEWEGCKCDLEAVAAFKLEVCTALGPLISVHLPSRYCGAHPLPTVNRYTSSGDGIALARLEIDTFTADLSKW